MLLLCAVPAAAHEVRPAYLQLQENQPGEFAVLWKTPMRGELRLSLDPNFSGRTRNLTPVIGRAADSAMVQTWRLRAVDPLRGQTLRVAGLAGTMTDALVRIDFADGTGWTQRLTPGSPSALIPAGQSTLAVAGVYLQLGVEHILRGVDHLLFVLALLIIVTGVTTPASRAGSLITDHWPLIKTVTAFTVAHSLTLAVATLGFVRVPPAPVEAVIALSIVFVAAEIIHARRGIVGLTARAPWIVAFTFGLLHGFGFAGALSAIGLPQGRIPVALLFFNVGVEVGQLLFVAAALCALAVVRHLRVPIPRGAELVPAYGIGTIAMFWVMQRVVGF